MMVAKAATVSFFATHLTLEKKQAFHDLVVTSGTQ